MMSSIDGWRDGWMDGKHHEKRSRRPLLYVIKQETNFIMNQTYVYEWEAYFA
jgi:hypothetical protein